VLLICLLFGIVFSNPMDLSSIVKEVNAKNVGWTAEENPHFKWSTDKLLRKFGWKKEQEKKLPPAKIEHTMQIPNSFNAAQNWPKCTIISTIYDQAECGSCWAFAGTESAADRFCIATNGQFNQALSFGEMTECNNEADGCDGGSAQAVMDFMQQTGLVTDACYPYYIPTCPPQQEPCLNFVPTPNCWTNNTCAFPSSNWKPYMYSNAYQYQTVQDIQQGIMQSGPVMACFNVFEDFLSYKSGVYQHTSGAYLGGHCVKMIGWGVENGLPYWQCNNQWTTYWGNQGTFRILLGQDECGIEDSVFAGTPSV
jgi:cathepsin B